jgi:hypothetical protein
LNPATLVTLTPRFQVLFYHTTTSEKAIAMVDWTILSPTFLRAAVEWAGAVVTVFAVGSGRSTQHNQRREQ